MIEKITGDYESGVLPEGVRVYAIGDIHGRLDLLKEIVGTIRGDNAKRIPAQTFLIFLGDYVDRGPDSKGVIDYLLTSLPEEFETVFLKGNHEQLLMHFAADPAAAQTWLSNGGDAALLSYGLEPSLVQAACARKRSALRTARDEFTKAMPEAHALFYNSLHDSTHAEGYFFVHAGVRPGVPLDLQDVEDLLWIRDEFLEWQGDFGAVVVHGHTPVAYPENYHNRIGIDTYAFKSGRLTAVGLEGRNRWFLST